MTEYIDHTRVAQQLLDQQEDINRLTEERDQLRQVLHVLRYGMTRASGRQLAADYIVQLIDTTSEMDLGPCDAEAQAVRANRAEEERDGAYRERAQLLAWLTALYASHAVLVPALDIDDEDGWHLLFFNVAGRQMSWHISPRDTELFKHVELVDVGDARAQWDGHTTDEKYQRIRTMPWGEMRDAVTPAGPTNVLLDDQGVPLCTCTYGQRCPNCPPDTRD